MTIKAIREAEGKEELIIREVQMAVSEVFDSANMDTSMVWNVLVNMLCFIETKAPGQTGHIDLSGWTKEAQIEATHYSEPRGIQRTSVLSAVVIKARGKSIADSYLVLRLGDVFDG